MAERPGEEKRLSINRRNSWNSSENSYDFPKSNFYDIPVCVRSNDSSSEESIGRRLSSASSPVAPELYCCPRADLYQIPNNNKALLDYDFPRTVAPLERPLPPPPQLHTEEDDGALNADCEYFRQEWEESARLLSDAVCDFLATVEKSALLVPKVRLLNETKLVVICGHKMAAIALAVARRRACAELERECVALRQALRHLVAAVLAASARAPTRETMVGVRARAADVANGISRLKALFD